MLSSLRSCRQNVRIPIKGVLKTEWLPQNVDDLDRDES